MLKSKFTNWEECSQITDTMLCLLIHRWWWSWNWTGSEIHWCELLFILQLNFVHLPWTLIVCCLWSDHQACTNLCNCCWCWAGDGSLGRFLTRNLLHRSFSTPCLGGGCGRGGTEEDWAACYGRRWCSWWVWIEWRQRRKGWCWTMMLVVEGRVMLGDGLSWMKTERGSEKKTQRKCYRQGSRFTFSFIM